MKLSSRIVSIFLAALMILASLPASAADDDMLMYKNSDFIEKEKPELSDETKRLISIYQKSPTEENYLNLQNAVIENYNAVLERKEAKLEGLKAETAGKKGGEV